MHKQSSKCLWTPGAAQVRSSLSVKSGRLTETISTIRAAESQPIVNPHGQRIAHLWRSGLACRSYTQCQSNGNETCESRGFESLQVCRNLNSPLMVDSFSDILTRCNWYFPTFFFFFRLPHFYLNYYRCCLHVCASPLPCIREGTVLLCLWSARLPKIVPMQWTAIRCLNRFGLRRCHYMTVD